jgi:TetR/AcrR family transcriptional repressor of nem operon
MGRVSRATADRHHGELIRGAARLVRERDFAEVSVPDVMGTIGLTRGGFYKHFESKEALVAAAVAEVFDQHLQRIGRLAGQHSGDPHRTRQALVDAGLSAEQRDDPGNGCPAALASGIARCDPDGPVRATYLECLQTLIATLVEHTAPPSKDPTEVRQEVIGDLATVVGGLLLARATAGTPLSDEILAAARHHLRDPAAVQSPSRTKRRHRDARTA